MQPQTIKLSKYKEISVEDEQVVVNSTYEESTYFDKKEARALLRALRKFEADGLLED